MSLWKEQRNMKCAKKPTPTKLISYSLFSIFGINKMERSESFCSNPHHACCGKTSVLKHGMFSTQSVCPVQAAPPEDSNVVERSSQVHPAAGFLGLISQAHAGSTLTANKLILNYFQPISWLVCVWDGVYAVRTSVQRRSVSEWSSLCFLEELAVVLHPTEGFIEWRTLMRWLRGTVTCD